MFKLIVKLNNQNDSGTPEECARVLRRAADIIEDISIQPSASLGWMVQDINGNTIGRVVYLYDGEV